MIDLEPLLQELANQLQNVVLDENNACCIRFNVGEETWKVFVEVDTPTEKVSIWVRRRD